MELVVVGVGRLGQKHIKDGMISRSGWHQHISKGIGKSFHVITLLLATLGQCNAKQDHALSAWLFFSITFFDMYGTSLCVGVLWCVDMVWVWYYLIILWYRTIQA